MTWESLQQQLPKSYTRQEIDVVRRAYELVAAAREGRKRKSGEPSVIHPLAVAGILAELQLDCQTVAAGLLHDVAEDPRINLPDLTEDFGPEVASLVDGVTRLAEMPDLAMLSEQERGARIEALRKLFLALVGDERVMLIKLADRVHQMRALATLAPEEQRRMARETLDLYAPMANLLGVWQLKWELEDLSFRYLEPQTYAEMQRSVAQRHVEREAYVASISQQLKAALARAGITAEITGRPKHLYSIWRKMKKKGVGFDQVYDRHGLRVVVPEVADCYAALGIVHQLWRPVPGEFDDYIANPKANGYQSLHTAVLSPDGQPLEVQVRTRAMDQMAEVGVAAHWRYKTQTRHDALYERRMGWVRSALDWQARDRGDDEGILFEGLGPDLFKDRVYVFTPSGEVFDLPTGATPIDLAYSVHTDVGHRCRGARVNGQLVNLDYRLQNGDQVEVITGKRGGPSREWLKPQSHYVKTQRARNRIRQYFREQERQAEDDSPQDGRDDGAAVA